MLLAPDLTPIDCIFTFHQRKVLRAGCAAAQDDKNSGHPFNSGFGFLTSARYVVRGRVFNSPSRL